MAQHGNHYGREPYGRERHGGDRGSRQEDAYRSGGPMADPDWAQRQQGNQFGHGDLSGSHYTGGSQGPAQQGEPWRHEDEWQQRGGGLGPTSDPGFHGRGGHGWAGGGAGQPPAQPQPQQRHPDPDYHQWRSEQMRSLDEDYDSWRQERYRKFSDEFNQWRQGRQQQARPADAGGKNDGKVGDRQPD